MCSMFVSNCYLTQLNILLGLPSKSLCYFSVLMDGSLTITKEQNARIVIWVNGHRIPVNFPMPLESADVITIGSSHLCFQVQMDDAEDEDYEQRSFSKMEKRNQNKSADEA